MPTRADMKSNRHSCTLSLLDFVFEIIVYNMHVDHKHNQPEFHGTSRPF